MKDDKDLQAVEWITQTVKEFAEEHDMDLVIIAGKTSEKRGTYMFSEDHNGDIQNRLFLERLSIQNTSKEISDAFNPSPNSTNKSL